MTRILALAVVVMVVGSCSSDARAPSAKSASADGVPEVCQTQFRRLPLPAEVAESSGLAHGRSSPDLFWTHNDSGGDPVLFGVDAQGRLVSRVRVAGARLIDWEDLEAGSCAAGNCLYIADIGDNDARRPSITIYEVPEPAPGASESAPARVLNARYPDQPQDAESLFRLPSGDLYIVTKGRTGPITLYRFPLSSQTSELATLERVKQLAPMPRRRADWVTAASASPDGSWVAIRTYTFLSLFRTSALLGPGAAEPISVDLQPLGESNGEAVVLDNDGSVWLTSEGKGERLLPSWSHLSCQLPPS